MQIQSDIDSANVTTDTKQIYKDKFGNHHRKLTEIKSRLEQVKTDAEAMELVTQAPEIVTAFKREAGAWKKVQAALRSACS